MRCPGGRARWAARPGLLVPALAVALLVVLAFAAHAQSRPPRSEQVPSPTWSRAPQDPASPSAGSGDTAAAPKASRRTKAVPPAPSACNHTVRAGESISRIGARYKVSRASLIAANQLVNPHALRAGQHLIVPDCRPHVQTARAEPPVLTPAVDGSVTKRVGPLRILTKLVLAEPDFQGASIPLVWPVEGPVISAFGQRPRGGWHAGIDITAELGSPVHAAAAGTVAYAGWIRAYGMVVKIDHVNGFTTLYAHNLKNLVEPGEDVEAGQVIAAVGRSGHATGPHVHFEVRRDGKAYNPLHLLDASDHSPVFEDDVAASSSEHDSHE